MPGESGNMSDRFCVAIYYAARSYVELQTFAIDGASIEVEIPLSVLPRQLGAAVAGDRLRIQFRGGSAKPSPILKVVILSKEKALGRQVLRLGILDWDKVARYWRVRTEGTGESD
jgi:hypothetical protein